MTHAFPFLTPRARALALALPAWLASGPRRILTAALACALGAGPLPASAHDTWLSLHGAPSPGLLTLALSTGRQFPLADSAHRAEGLAGSGCTGGDARGKARALALRAREEGDTALLLRVRADRAAGAALSCWVRAKPLAVELTPALVQEYLREIQAPVEVLARWDALRAQGASWREVYGKTARLEHLADAGASPAAIAAIRKPTGQALEIVPLGDQAVRVGEPLAVQVLDDGQPVAGLPVQLASEELALRIWQRSDERGQLRYPPLPSGGRWLLRATRLVPPDSASGQWRSRFSTLVLRPLPKP